MEIFRSVQAMQEHADQQRCAGKKLALVPTMGALHHGHLALATHAGKIANHVTVSIFVNPTQFGPHEDFDAYPRTLSEDLAKLEGAGVVDAVFVPEVEAMYPRFYDSAQHVRKSNLGQQTWVRIEDMDRHLCGQFREGHFLGVTTVVTKLFNACKPHLGVFGLKDAQQFLILRRMAEDLNTGIKLVGVPTIREEDGLAASSRNVYLTPIQRRHAPCLHEALQLARTSIEAGERSAQSIKSLVKSHIQLHSEGVIQYIEVVDTENIQPVEDLRNHNEVLIALAVFFGATRLIDNVFVAIK